MNGGGWWEQVLSGRSELTAEQLFLHRRPRREETNAARAALLALDEIEAEQPVADGKTKEFDARVLFDRRLLAQKEPLRRYPPVRVRCRCGRGLEWIAIAPLSDHGLQLVHGPRLVAPSVRQGGAYSIEPGKQRGPFGKGSAIGTVTWAEDTEAGIGNSRTLPSGPHGDVYALKAHYRCPSCRYEQTVLHVTLLRRFLTAVLLGERGLHLGPLPGVAQASKPKVAKVVERRGAMAWYTRGGPTSRSPELARRAPSTP